MGTTKHRWKLSFRRSSTSTAPSPIHSSSSPSPSSSSLQEEEATKPPAEFLCPISGTIMADPVIVPSGHTFERACIQACKDLSFLPPSLVEGDPSSLLLIPNSALRSTILAWCHHSSLPSPQPIPPDAALLLVHRVIDITATSSACVPAVEEDPSTSNPPSSSKAPATPPLPAPTKTPSCYSSPRSSSSHSSYYYSSSSSSSEITPISNAATEETITAATEETITTATATMIPQSPPPPPPSGATTAGNDDYAMEEEILSRLRDPRIYEQELGLVALRQATRESRARRVALCTPRLLSALRRALLSRYPTVQSNAAAALVNLSLEPPNKVRIVRSGAVPPLVEALKCGHPEARDHAAGALFSLALEDENKAAIGVLGAIPPLLDLFSRRTPVDSFRARRDAGVALYHLSFAGTNRSKIAKTPGAVKSLVDVAIGVKRTESQLEETSLAKVAMMVVCNIAGSGEGRAAMMDAGVVAAVVGMIREGKPAKGMEALFEYCVAALYGMSRGSLRFRGLASAAGAEEVLETLLAAANESSGGGDDGGGMSEAAREMVSRTLRALRGEEDDDFVSESVVSDGVVSFRRRYRDFVNVSGVNSAEF